MHRDSPEGFCPLLALESSDVHAGFKLFRGWNEAGWVEYIDRGNGVLEGRVVQQKKHITNDAGAWPPYELPRAPSGGYAGHIMSMCSMCLQLVATASVLLGLVMCVTTCLSLDIWYDVEVAHVAEPFAQVFPMTFRPRTGSLNTTADTDLTRQHPASIKLLKIKLVCNPNWLLAGNTLSGFISHSCSEVVVLPKEAAELAFPHGALRDFEAVVQVPTGTSMEEVGRILQAIMEKRRMSCGEQPLSSRLRLPRFQVIASIGNTFLHFGGSIGCGHRRFRSCPARATSDRCLAVRVHF